MKELKQARDGVLTTTAAEAAAARARAKDMRPVPAFGLSHFGMPACWHAGMKAAWHASMLACWHGGRWHGGRLGNSLACWHAGIVATRDASMPEERRRAGALFFKATVLPPRPALQ